MDSHTLFLAWFLGETYYRVVSILYQTTLTQYMVRVILIIFLRVRI